MPDWIQKLHPTAVLGGLIFIGLASADHFLSGKLQDWTTQDINLLYIGGGALGLSIVTGANTSTAVGVASSVASSVADAVAQAVKTAVPPAPTPVPPVQ